MSKPAQFVAPQRILTGPGCFAQLGEQAVRLGKKALIVCGRSAARKSGTLGKAVESIQTEGGEVVTFDQVEPEPSLATVRAARATCRDAGCDIVIGIGGGSALDVAKTVGGLAHSERSIDEHFAGAPGPPTGLPIIAVPTTAGTGSEVTMNCVLCAPETTTKKSIRGGALLPTVAVVDPELLLSLPRNLTANAGMDALTQAIESFTSIHATRLTDGLAFEAFRQLTIGLPRALADGTDLEARTQTAYGSLMAGMALANARLGVVHGLAHPLGIRCHIPHGLVCGALLPFAIRLNEHAAAAKYERLSEELKRPLLDFVEDMVQRSGIADAFKQYDVQPKDFDALAHASLPSGSLKANPKPVTKDDLVQMLKQVTGRRA